jgi:2-oxoglutarate dehydrogenase E2 component (dihydrolipoamide succinyltransferase)
MTDQNHRLTLPSMGEGVSEASVVRWLKNIGDKIALDEPVIEVSTDKVDTEIVSSFAGYLVAIFVHEGDTVQVGQTIAQISSRPDAPVEELPSNQSSSSQHTIKSMNKPRREQPTYTKSSIATFAGEVKASPLVKKLAKEYSVDLRQVEGSGLYGRVTKDDVLHFVQEQHPPSQNEGKFQLNIEKKENKEYLEGVLVERSSMSKIRKLTADHMASSVRTSPHVTTTFEVCFSRVSDFKENFKKTKLTYTAFFIQAAAASLQKYPVVNSSVDGHDVLYKKDINIGCAVATDSGLIVPVLKRAQEYKTIEDIALQLQTLIEKTKNKKLLPTDIIGGTFSITNMGMYGSIHSQPIINQPQVAIMSIGAIVERGVVEKGKIVIRPMCNIGLTFDHRVVDGHEGALFLKDIKEFLENYSG